VIGVTRAQLEALAARAPDPKNFHQNRRHSSSTKGDVLSRARAYIATIPGAVAGQRGHDRTFYAANRLVRGFALDPDAAYPLLAEWNQKCDPPWSEYDLRRKLEEAARQPGPRGFKLNEDPLPPGAHARRDGSHSTGSAAQFRNFTWDEVRDGETMRRVRRGRRGPELFEELLAFTGGWPRRVGSTLFVPDGRENLLWLESASQLVAWLETQYSAAGGKGLDWFAGSDCVSQQVFFDLCCQLAEDFDQVELYPHEPPLPRTFYYHPEPTGGDGKALADLLCQFIPATDIDGDLIRAYFLSLFWGGKPGQRPGWLFTVAEGDDKGGRGVGKTTIAIAGANLVGGYISVRARENFDTLMQRLLSPGSAGKRVLLLDNLKRDRYSNQDLEALITSTTISGKRMYKGEGQRPNYFTIAVTANDPGVSEDIAQRAIIVRLLRPDYDPEWLVRLNAYIEANRWSIIGDCLAQLRSQPQSFLLTSRWAEWQRAVLSKLPNPDVIQTEIRSRERSHNTDAEEREWVQASIEAWLSKHKWDPAGQRYLIEVKVLARIIGDAAGEPMTPNAVGLYLKHNHPSCLTRSNRNGVRYWLWSGSGVDPEQTPLPIDHWPEQKPREDAKESKGEEGADSADASSLF
jgi:hypothetical protein